MPKLSAPENKRPIRLLLVGDPGARKTTAYGHLLAHAQKLFVASFDDKLDPILAHVPREHHGNLVFERLVDKVRPHPSTGFPTTIGKPTAFRRFINLTENWKDTDGTDYGKPETWDENSWLIIDSLTSLGDAALRYTQDEVNKMGEKVSLPTLGRAIGRVEGVPQTLLSYPINTITTAHLAPMSAAEDIEIQDAISSPVDKEKAEARAEAKLANPYNNKRFPYTLGRKLPRRIGAYFTAVLYCRVEGSGKNARGLISTLPQEDVDVICPTAPGKVPAEVGSHELWKVIEAIRAGQ